MTRHELIQSKIPRLAESVLWKITSPVDDRYNCIAWAACDDQRWWWPALFPRPDGQIDHWPNGVPRTETLDAFIHAFAGLGYSPCISPRFEFGYQKVAIYADADGTPTHMARQFFFLGWLSKLGPQEDIWHWHLRDVEGSDDPTSDEYGSVKQILKRNWWIAFKHWTGRRR